jgi:hypothetical protein
LPGGSVWIPHPTFTRRREVPIGDSRRVAITALIAIAVSVALPVIAVAVVLTGDVAIPATFAALVFPIVGLRCGRTRQRGNHS